MSRRAKCIVDFETIKQQTPFTGPGILEYKVFKVDVDTHMGDSTCDEESRSMTHDNWSSRVWGSKGSIIMLTFCMLRHYLASRASTIHKNHKASPRTKYTGKMSLMFRTEANFLTRVNKHNA